MVYGMLWDTSHTTFFIVLLAVGFSPAALLLFAWRPFAQVRCCHAKRDVGGEAVYIRCKS